MAAWHFFLAKGIKDSTVGVAFYGPLTPTPAQCQ